MVCALDFIQQDRKVLGSCLRLLLGTFKAAAGRKALGY